MIRSFADKATQDIFDGIRSRQARQALPVHLHALSARKIDMIQAAKSLDDLKIPAGNRLEPLRGDLKGFYGIRINSQWRIIFQWEDGGADNVQVIDYH